jgi:hypothetical protein
MSWLHKIILEYIDINTLRTRGLEKKKGFGMYGPIGQDIVTHKTINNSRNLVPVDGAHHANPIKEADPVGEADGSGFEAGKSNAASANAVAVGNSGSSSGNTIWGDSDTATHVRVGKDIYLIGANHPDPADAPKLSSEEEKEVKEKIKKMGLYPVRSSPKLSPNVAGSVAATAATDDGKTFSLQRNAAERLVQVSKDSQVVQNELNKTYAARAEEAIELLLSQAETDEIKEILITSAEFKHKNFVRNMSQHTDPEQYITAMGDFVMAFNASARAGVHKDFKGDDAKAVQAFISKYEIRFGLKHKIYALREKLLRRPKSEGKLISSKLAEKFKDHILANAGKRLLIKPGSTSPFSPQALVSVDETLPESRIDDKDGRITVTLAGMSISEITADDVVREDGRPLTKEELDEISNHNFTVGVTAEIFVDNHMEAVVVTPVEGRREMLESLKAAVASERQPRKPLLSSKQLEDRKVKLQGHIDKLGEMQYDPANPEQYYQEFDAEVEAFTDSWRNEGLPNTVLGKLKFRQFRGRSFTTLTETLSTIYETGKGNTVIIPNSMNFPGTDIISIPPPLIEGGPVGKFDFIYTTAGGKIEPSQVKNRAGAPSAFKAKLDGASFKDSLDEFGKVIKGSGAKFKKAMQHTTEKGYDAIWKSNDPKLTEAKEIIDSTKKYTMGIIQETTGLHSDHIDKFYDIIAATGRIPVIRNGVPISGNTSPSVMYSDECVEFRDQWKAQNTLSVLTAMAYNAQVSSQANSLQQYNGDGLNIAAGNKEGELWHIKPHPDKGTGGRSGKCTPTNKFSTSMHIPEQSGANESIEKSGTWLNEIRTEYNIKWGINNGY